MLVDSSTESEAIATGKVGEVVSYGREIFRAMGIAPDGPTLVGTDNRANQLLSSGEGAPTRMKHAIRRFKVFVQRVQAGECRLIHVPDEFNASDYLTKMVNSNKVEGCDRYATGCGNKREREVPIGSDRGWPWPTAGNARGA